MQTGAKEFDMAQNIESKHAPELRKRGFTRGPGPGVITGLSRNERRVLNKKKKTEPFFTMSDAVTLATDEAGQQWVGPPNTNLSDLGFGDNTSALKVFLGAVM